MTPKPETGRIESPRSSPRAWTAEEIKQLSDAPYAPLRGKSPLRLTEHAKFVQTEHGFALDCDGEGNPLVSEGN